MSEQRPGILQQLEPGVARVLCDNPSPFTFTGTQTHLVGTAELAVIDPGPDDPAHLAALLAAIDGRRVAAVVVTHNHRDHSPLARPLADATQAPIVGCAALTVVREDGGPDASFDTAYAPDRVLTDGETLTAEGWALTAVATPGHTSNHLAFALDGTGALFSGDHVMGWSTTVVIPPDGDMGAYMASLETLLARDDRVYFPAHGEPVDQPRRLVRGLLGHRRQREGQILRRLATGPQTIAALVAAMYVGLDPRLLGGAERSVLAHLLDLARRGEVMEQGAGWGLSPL